MQDRPHLSPKETPLAIALRDCGISSITIVGIATEVGIEPTARHAADLCFIPVIIADACGGGDEATVFLNVPIVSSHRAIGSSGEFLKYGVE
jgi:nicotinamidase-related amidase